MIEEGASEEMDKSSKIQGTEEGGSLEKGPEDIFKVEVEKPTCETERKHLPLHQKGTKRETGGLRVSSQPVKIVSFF